MKLRPDMEDLLPLKGDALYKLKRYNKAIEVYSRFLKNHPKSHVTISRLSDCYLHMGHLRSAAIGYIHALKISPDYEPAKNKLEMLVKYDR